MAKSVYKIVLPKFEISAGSITPSCLVRAWDIESVRGVALRGQWFHSVDIIFCAGSDPDKCDYGIASELEISELTLFVIANMERRKVWMQYHKAKNQKVMICASCRGENVTAHATVMWDIDHQQLEIVKVLGGRHCEDCDSNDIATTMAPVKTTEPRN